MRCINCGKYAIFHNGMPIYCVCSKFDLGVKHIEFVECNDFMCDWIGIYVDGKLVKEGDYGEVSVYDVLKILNIPFKQYEISSEDMDYNGFDGFPSGLDSMKKWLKGV